MKKINRNKSSKIKLGLAIMSTALIASMTGCNTSKKNEQKQIKNYEKELDTIINNSKRVKEIEDVLELSEQVNKYLANDNLTGEQRDVNGVEYYDYYLDESKYEYGLNLDNYTLDEMKEITNNFNKLSDEDKKYFRMHLNAVLYYNNLILNYENFYRIILATATGEEYTPVYDEKEFHLYIEDGKKLIDNNKNKDLQDYEVLMNNYNIDKKNAINLYNLINTMPSIRFMVKEMNNGENEDYGSEDYIPELIDQLETSTKILNSLNWEYYEQIKNESSSKSKTKVRSI